MIKQIFLFSVSISLAFSITACDNNKTSKKANISATPQIKTGVAPVADNEIAVVEMENPAYGSIKIELYSNIAPQMVERFKTLAKEGFYNGTSFHRIVGPVLQGGDPNSKDSDPNNDGQGESSYPDLPAEFSDVPFERGTLGAARLGNDVNSANCQFYITMQRNPAWDKQYTVFGKVIEGMNNAQVIASVPKQGERPLEPVRIKTITLQPKQ
jgi:peptidylprolyl isomerase